MNDIKNNLTMVVSNANEKLSSFETIDTIAEAGFKNVFVQWYNRDWNPTQEEQIEYIKQKGLNIIFAHLGYDFLNATWLGNTYYRNLLIETYKHDLDCCYKYGIDLVIMHAHGKMNKAKFNSEGLRCFREIIDYAQKLNINVAIENTRLDGYLEFLLDNIKNENLGICFDAGHYHVHYKDQFNFDRFKDKILAVHLHDNDQSDDQHLLPFDGTLNWENVVNNLKKCNYKGPITIEVKYSKQYLEMEPIEFYKKAYSIGEKLYNMMYEE